jgi:hypothetical protein
MYSFILSLTSALNGGGWSTPRSGRFTTRKDLKPTVKEAGCAPGTVYTGIRSPDRPVRSKSLYRLSKMVMMMMMMMMITPTLSEPQSPEHSLTLNCGCTRRPVEAKGNFRQEQEMFHFSITFRPSLGHTHLLFNRYRGPFKEVKRPRREVDPSPPSSAKVKNKWSHIFITPPCLHAMCTKHYLYLQTQLQYKYIQLALCLAANSLLRRNF